MFNEDKGQLYKEKVNAMLQVCAAPLSFFTKDYKDIFRTGGKVIADYDS
jgi:hypothetical protein